MGAARGLEGMAKVGVRMWIPPQLCGYAPALMACDRGEEADRAIERTLVDNAQRGLVWCDAELWRLRGELQREQGEPGLAASSFERALSIARDQQARLWELHAATSLARLWADRHEPVRARQLLQPVLDGFTEGLDSTGVREARALLERVRRLAPPEAA